MSAVSTLEIAAESPARFNGQVVVISGASRGIGRACAEAFVSAGATVVGVSLRKSEEQRRLSELFEAADNGSYAVTCDVADPDEVKRLGADLVDSFESIQVLVNNAGVVSHAPLEEMQLAEWERVINSNLTSMLLMTQASIPLMREGSSIINVTSAVATVGMVARSHYTAAKAGVVGFTRSVCKELGPRGIRANCVAPGIIETDQVADLSPEQRARYGSLAALGRLGSPHDVAKAVLFLAGDEARFVSGVTLNVDGGI